MKNILFITLISVWSSVAVAEIRFNPLNVARVEGVVGVTHDELRDAISAENTAFSNAVLSVGLNIDTNSVAVLNELAATFGGLPIEGTATTVGGLLVALAAAIAWLKKNKLDKTDVVAPSESAANGQAADAKSVNDALTMKAPSNITTASDDKIRIVYGDNVWWIVPLGIYYWNDGEAGENAHSPTAVFALPTSAHDSSFALTSDIEDAVKNKADSASLAPEYSPSATYPVGSIVYHDGNIYQCKTAIADGGEAWNAAHWEMRKLSDFYTESNSLLTGLIASKTSGKADKDDLDALAAKVDAANAALEGVA